MTTSPDPALLHRRITEWFAENARELPWREPGCSPWGIMVSEFMLQQTPVVRVLPVWSQWVKRWPTPTDLASAPSGDAVRHWGRLGYPRRALRLHAAAVAIVEDHDGEVPRSYPDLLALPGVGTYTAAAISSFAFGLRATVVDTNIRRVHARAVVGNALPSPALTAAEMRLAETLMPDGDSADRNPAASPDGGADDGSAGAEARANARDETVTPKAWNAAVMELGAVLCTARSPKCSQCPVLDNCAWVAAGRPEPRYLPKGQAWTGTNRQVRGAMMAVLREAEEPVPADVLLSAPVDLAFGPPAASDIQYAMVHKLHALEASAEQLRKAFDSLLADGLARAVNGKVTLPH